MKCRFNFHHSIPSINFFETEDEHYTDDDHIVYLFFHRENDYGDIVSMDVEGRYEQLIVILEDTEIARGISRESKSIIQGIC